MARRPSTPTVPTTESPVESEGTVTEESTVSTDTTEVEAAPEAPEADAPESTEAEPTEAPAAEEHAEVEIDLTDFNAAVEAALPERDTTTGTLAEAFVAPIQKAYRELPHIKAKNAAKKSMNDAMVSSMNELDMPLARAYMQIWQSLKAEVVAKAEGKAKVEKAPVDPTDAFVELAAGLRLALILAAAHVPEGVSPEWNDKAKALVEADTEAATSYRAWLVSDAEDKGDEPEVSTIVKAAVKLSLGKSAKVGTSVRAASGGTSTYTGTRRDIAKHIVEAFADQPVGAFLKISEIKKFHSEEYGDESPSAGAISARLFPKNGKMTVPGVEAATDEKADKGARKIAV